MGSNHSTAVSSGGQSAGVELRKHSVQLALAELTIALQTLGHGLEEGGLARVVAGPRRRHHSGQRRS
jgi:hypothetical protein